MSEDWDKPTVIRKSRPSGRDSRTPAAINRAMAMGNVEVHKKMAGGGNKQNAAPANLSKIEGETEVFKVNTVDKSVAKAIVEGRQRKGLTQKDLATNINEKPQVIQEYESAKAIPNQAVLSKLERVLEVKLRGTNIGTPLVQPAKAKPGAK